MTVRVRWPNQQGRSTEGRWLVNHVKGQSTGLSSLKGKEKDVTYYVHRTMIQRHLEGKMLWYGIVEFNGPLDTL